MSVVHILGRIAFGGSLAAIGVVHLTPKGLEGFQVAVPDWMPGDKKVHVVWSGIAEICIGIGLVSGKKKRIFGRLAAALMCIVFPGNVWMYEEGIDGPGLDTDAKRRVRLFLQPVLAAIPLEVTRD